MFFSVPENGLRVQVISVLRDKLPCSENFWRYKRNYERNEAKSSGKQGSFQESTALASPSFLSIFSGVSSYISPDRRRNSLRSQYVGSSSKQRNGQSPAPLPEGLPLITPPSKSSSTPHELARRQKHLLFPGAVPKKGILAKVVRNVPELLSPRQNGEDG